jgi:RimJ/RimL family protein N-acetyltransferase
VKAHERPWEYNPAQAEDDDSVAGLVEGARWLHRHLDWASLESLLRRQPFLLATDEGIPVACLAVPPDSEGIAWIRVLAVASGYDVQTAWMELWRQIEPRLVDAGGVTVAALCLTSWLPALLRETDFMQADSVIHLELEKHRSRERTPARFQPERMMTQDLGDIARVDREAFDPIWRHSLEVLELALSQAEYATQVRVGSEAVAYQISTVSAHGGHLARLAVSPEWQGKGIATSMVLDAAHHFLELGLPRLTVNTQASNRGSQRLYQRLGFQHTGQNFPVFQLDLSRPS